MNKFYRTIKDSTNPIKQEECVILLAYVPMKIDCVKIMPNEIGNISTGVSIDKSFTGKVELVDRLKNYAKIVMITNLYDNEGEEIIITLKNISNNVICIEDEDEIVKLINN